MKQKITIILFCIIALLQNVTAQNNVTTLNDVGRIVLNATTIENTNVPVEAKQMLQNKLQQIATNNGVGGNSYNPRFIITAKANIISKNIVAGPPQAIALTVEFTFFIGDAMDNMVYANSTKTYKAVGSNENKAFIEAINQINVRSEDLKTFVEEGKNKIVNWYNTQCDFILKKAETLVTQQQYQEAIYTLMAVPDVCKDCYTKCNDATKPIFAAYQSSECNKKLNQAKQQWNVSQNSTTAKEVADILIQIYPDAPCYKEAETLAKTIKEKLDADAQKEWEFKMKTYNDKLAKEKLEYNDKIALEKQRLETYKQVAIEYAKKQPQTIIYNKLAW